VAGGRWVILCQRPISHLMESTSSSPTRNVLSSANNYAISSLEHTVLSNFSLHASLTVTGAITFTLTLTSGGDYDAPPQVLSIWRDTILTSRNQGVQRPWQRTVQRMMIPCCEISNRMNLRRHQPDGDHFYKTVQMPQLFLPELRSTIHAICVCLWRDYLHFVSGGGDESELDTLDEAAINFWRQTSYEAGFP